MRRPGEYDDDAGFDRRQLGLVLRMVGPLLQIASLMLLLRPGVADMTLAGTPARSWLYGAFLLGFLLVVAGMALSRRSTRR